MSNANTTPLLSDEGRCWWKNVLDLEEAKSQVLFSLPMILTNLVYFSLTLVSVMFAGHLGELHLAGATLANSWATVTGFAFMVLDRIKRGIGNTLRARIWSKNLQSIGNLPPIRMHNLMLFRPCNISLMALHRADSDIASPRRRDLKNCGTLHKSQSILMPLVWFSVLPLALHLAIVYSLVNWTGLGFKGAPLATSISLWISLLLLAFYVVLAKRFEQTWTGLSLESFRFLLANLKLALPSAAMVCLEYWAFEFLVLLAGLMPNSEVTTSLIAMCVNTETIAYMITYGLSAAASTRVSNELGAGNTRKAKAAMAVSLQLSVLLALTVVLALAFGHNIWAASFSNSAAIINQFASMTPLLLISITLDSFQGILSGVARGIGWQLLAVWANLGTFYFIGMPIAGLLAFKFKLYAKGLWIGLICGLYSQAGALLVIALFRKWTKIELS
ncbi:hypothetical protein V6N13_013076 [Hibiscus sabdariffa]